METKDRPPTEKVGDAARSKSHKIYVIAIPGIRLSFNMPFIFRQLSATIEFQSP